MNNIYEDKVLCSELVRSFPKEMIKQIETIISKLNNCNVKGLSAYKGVNEHCHIAFEVEQVYRMLFDYYENKTMSLSFVANKDEDVLKVNNVCNMSDDKLNLIVEVINETIYKDSLINNTRKNK